MNMPNNLMVRAVSLLGRPLLGRSFHTSSSLLHMGEAKSFKPQNLGKNLANFDILGLSDKPSNNIEMISKDSIIFTNLTLIKSPTKDKRIVGALLLNNEVYQIDLTDRYEIHNKFIMDLDESILKVFSIIYPKPELVVIGMGGKPRMLHQNNKEYLNKLGIQYEVSDTKNSALNYDLLATERGVTQIAGLILPPNL
ncbi:Hypothetical protein PP7435_CHR1-0944 [Komagataella phaffii CBS 7435]|uniref:NADH dehydrogenase [ubiquinone] 1 alpha subcomplex assembly factor 3 n=2 Tax=Komagataella phaffii TaxID=460519 RepID=C4QXN0_KOMPG|nr:Hypothetical protein PAS_chr1-4_0170 [Komagataella phaffii GS115]AOA60490.1 GQ67_02012T0 [Komagataella phaffii]CAH2446818.1 Hypothetical protein BQ9382_C1-4980 [Komagataella phaffii CBS 7435]AOA66140.1 GQ68_02027T0 [Komagataella phaffii GS115]CAY68003.1 Hypothetical protein PAS_chr1-4_0170 [Komagataella phaffii GS115]SCV11880.1 Hypothetical protein PP7435_CHR1-0944 [Komagataella phaffii CBS 7435]